MKRLLFQLGLCLLVSCKGSTDQFDASGSFEADEVIVSSELSGQILDLAINEGDSLTKGQVVGTIDADNISLQKQQVEATIRSLSEKTSSAAPSITLLENQLAVQQSQLTNLQHEKQRVERLLKADAATGKQLDDINAQIDVTGKQMRVTKQQIAVQKTSTGTQNRSIMSEGLPLRKQAAQLEEQLTKSKITNPINGFVTTRYAEAGEVTAPGKALYKVSIQSRLIRLLFRSCATSYFLKSSP
jgi:HlyD family secretion protein